MGAVCCKGSLVDDPQFNILSRARSGEDGAGYLSKYGKQTSLLKRRFFVIRGSTIEYFTDETRGERKGSFVLFPRTSITKKSKADENKRIRLQISHPRLDTRTLLAVGPNEATCWTNALNGVIERMQKKGACEAVLHKRGGVSKNEWQERFCVFDGERFSSWRDPADEKPVCVRLCKHAWYTPQVHRALWTQL